MIGKSLVFAFSSCTNTNSALFLPFYGGEGFQKSTAHTSDLQFFWCLSDKGSAGTWWEGTGVWIYSAIIFLYHELTIWAFPSQMQRHSFELLNMPKPISKPLSNTRFECVTHPETAGEWDSSWKSSWGLFLVLITSTCCYWTHMKWQKPEFLL